MKPENCGYCAACARDDFANCTTFTRAAPLHAVDAPVGAKEFYDIYCKSMPHGFTGAGWVPFDELPERTQAPWREMAALASTSPSAPGMASVDAAEDARDAARYRWLRANREQQTADGTFRDVYDEDGTMLSHESLDHAIDVAIDASRRESK